MNIPHATIDPPLLVRLKQMPDSAHRADIAVGSDSGQALFGRRLIGMSGRRRA